jgi:hypothetical protein
MLMIAQRLSTDHLVKAGSQSKLPRRNARGGRLPFSKLHDAKNNEMGSHVSETP